MGIVEKLYKTKEGVKPLDYSKVHNWLINNNFDYLKKYDLTIKQQEVPHPLNIK